MTSSEKIVGLFGKPLAQSISKKMHTAHFKAQSDALIYLPFELDTGTGFKEAIAATPYLNFLGFNLTKPDKIDVIPLLDELNQSAELIGAVNTVKVEAGRLIGYNTDGEGFVRSLLEMNGVDVKGQRLCILGVGGAGRACAFSALMAGASHVDLLNRSEDKAKALADEIQTYNYSASAYQLTDAMVEEKINTADIIINATGLGMYESIDMTPVKQAYWHKNIIACDLTYNPVETLFLKDAKKAGAKTVNGIGMIVYQGALAYEIWTGKQANIDVMMDVVASTL